MRGWDCKLSVNVVVSRNASQSNEVPIAPILRSVTGTLRIAAGLFDSGNTGEFLRVEGPNTVFASSLAPPASNQNQSASIRDKKATSLIKMAVLGCMKVQTISSPIGYSRVIICMYVCTYVHTLTQARQDLPSSRHPVKDGLKKSHTALPDKCD